MLKPANQRISDWGTPLAPSVRHVTHLQLADVLVSVQSDHAFSLALSEFDFTNFFCDSSVVPETINASVTVLVQRGDAFSYERCDDRAAVITIPQECTSVDKVLYATFPLVESARQSRSAVTIHAAGVSVEGSGVLLLGKEGAGKTSVALRLCADGASIVGNDLVILSGESGKLNLLAGTKYFHLRKASLAQELSQYLPHFPPDRIDAWTNKIIRSSASLGIPNAKGPIPLVFACSVHVDENQENVRVTDISRDLPTRLALFENFSRYIRATAIPGLNADNRYSFYLPSHDSTELHSKRIAILARILDAPLLYISGRSRDIAHAIKSHLESKAPRL